MNRQSIRQARERFIEDVRAKQRNIVFPDTLRNSWSVDWFLWHGSPSPLVVQRIGAWLVGLGCIALGLTGAGITYEVSALGLRVTFGSLAALCLYCGGRIFRNGFARSGPDS